MVENNKTNKAKSWGKGVYLYGWIVLRSSPSPPPRRMLIYPRHSGCSWPHAIVTWPSLPTSAGVLVQTKETPLFFILYTIFHFHPLSPCVFQQLIWVFLFKNFPILLPPPLLPSRVTLVNFTVTPASLVNQCRAAILRVERPDTEKKWGLGFILFRASL